MNKRGRRQDQADPEQPTRRDFLSASVRGLGLLALSSTVPAFVPRIARADQVVGSAVANDNVLVVVQLSGGNDGLNTIIPAGDAYTKLRGRLAIADRTHRLDDAFALNPGMEAFKRLYDDGQLGIVHACGYPKPNRSHFESMQIWHTADPTAAAQTGWLGHYLDHLDRGTSSDQLLASQATLGAFRIPAIHVGGELPQALVNARATVPSVRDLRDFEFRFDRDSVFDIDLERELLRQAQQTGPTADPTEEFLSRQAIGSIQIAAEIRRKTNGYVPDATYPGNLGERLKLIANLIAAGLGTRVFYCEIGGFDTHANQLQTHEQLLKNVADSIEAFLTDLRVKKLASKVTVMCFSEFGRRLKPNDSNGTDHGAAGPMFVVGPRVRPGLHGTHPSLESPEDGDLPHTTDFRAIYGQLLANWLNADARAVLGTAYDGPSIF
jgi:uncharacterized protein (DUF1501 family)